MKGSPVGTDVYYNLGLTTMEAHAVLECGTTLEKLSKKLDS